jgi:hypothetical protein
MNPGWGFHQRWQNKNSTAVDQGQNCEQELTTKSLPRSITSKKENMNNTKQNAKNYFFIEIQQDYTEFTEVTTLPPHLIIGIKICSWLTLSTLENENEVSKSDK